MPNKKSLLTLAALLLVLTAIVSACGSNNSKGSSTSANKAESTAAPAATDAPQAEEQFRTYKTDKGDVQIPVKPQRIVTDYYGGELLSVGANVVGVEPTTFDNPFLKDLLKDAKEVGAPADPEKTLDLKPDLIVVMYDENYEALSKIAPTIHIPYGTTSNISEAVKLFGDIVGTPEKADEFLANFDKKAAEGREKLKGIIDENATFGLYELTDKGELWVFGDNAGRGGQAVYNALGLKMPEKISADKATTQLSLEVLPDYAADYMFLTTYDPEKKGEEIGKLKNSPVWKNLDASKNNTIFYNDFDTFYRYDPIAITGQIDMIVDMLIARSEENKK
ncbi:ABC transporter substrate-binding protein [Paenibacillus radicis (ex Gao et al. 2016)]|uniref:Iron(3+)-hydroxamate-binding protein YxeB n=1 Tax=Paenibacillus radicis (ex Gao et al. 2016) TaxID=1737354 RepID=A0A917H0Y4_9BACL|nr:ABC transporter substrate-binding protein [Paenibacillus radicis (ex Gao et al. 2016)]GGG64025.1 iron(3+)-hydroxamate-binding protein YxeB [Paenibacillus radicis (ex Gao et al. 2016)]